MRLRGTSLNLNGNPFWSASGFIYVKPAGGRYYVRPTGTQFYTR